MSRQRDGGRTPVMLRMTAHAWRALSHQANAESRAGGRWVSVAEAVRVMVDEYLALPQPQPQLVEAGRVLLGEVAHLVRLDPAAAARLQEIAHERSESTGGRERPRRPQLVREAIARGLKAESIEAAK